MASRGQTVVAAAWEDAEHDRHEDSRPAALERLRAGDRFGSRAAVVRAQLGEDDLDGAWSDANEGGCDEGT